MKSYTLIIQERFHAFEQNRSTIVVSAAAYVSQQNASVVVNDVGMVDLASRQIELSGAGRAEFDNLSISAQMLNQLASSDYKISVNVLSGRRSSANNLLDCGFFDDTISKIQPGIELQYKLIGE